jgi:hypothetical protein
LGVGHFDVGILDAHVRMLSWALVGRFPDMKTSNEAVTYAIRDRRRVGRRVTASPCQCRSGNFVPPPQVRWSYSVRVFVGRAIGNRSGHGRSGLPAGLASAATGAGLILAEGSNRKNALP